MSNLTLDKMLETMRALEKMAPRPEPSLFDSPFRFRPLGLNLYEAPPPPPKIQLRDIKLDDGTSILSPEFRAQMQAWLTARFGFQKDLFAHNAYILGGHSIVMSRNHLAVIQNLGA